MRFPRCPHCTECKAAFTDERWKAVEHTGWGPVRMEARPTLCGDCDLQFVVAIAAATTDVRGAIGFSSFGVLAYYAIAIAKASAWTLTPVEGRPARIIPVVGLAGCLVLAFALSLPSVVIGAAVLLIGAAAYATRRVTTERR